MQYRIRFAPEARRDLEDLYLYIAEEAGPDRALAYVERIEKFCLGFADFPQRGILRDDLFPGLRIVGFERRISVAFKVVADTVIFYRFLYGGRDLAAALGDF